MFSMGNLVKFGGCAIVLFASPSEGKENFLKKRAFISEKIVKPASFLQVGETDCEEQRKRSIAELDVKLKELKDIQEKKQKLEEQTCDRPEEETPAGGAVEEAVLAQETDPAPVPAPEPVPSKPADCDWVSSELRDSSKTEERKQKLCTKIKAVNCPPKYNLKIREKCEGLTAPSLSQEYLRGVVNTAETYMEDEGLDSTGRIIKNSARTATEIEKAAKRRADDSHSQLLSSEPTEVKQPTPSA